MSKPEERLHRIDPARLGPIRNRTAAPRPTPAGAGVGPLPSPPPPPPGMPGYGATPGPAPPPGAAGAEPAPGGPVQQGVALGYQVLDEQIRLGQRVAAGLSGRPYGPGLPLADFAEITDRLVRSAAGLGSLWLEWWNLWTLGALRPGVAGPWATYRPTSFGAGGAWPSGNVAPSSGPAPPTDGGAAGAGDDEAVAVAIEVASSRPVRTALRLPAGAEALHLATPGLRSLDPAAPALSGVAFEPPTPGPDAVVTLRLHVPDDVPADTYHGVVVDRRTGAQVGTLGVTVGA